MLNLENVRLAAMWLDDDELERHIEGDRRYVRNAPRHGEWRRWRRNTRARLQVYLTERERRRREGRGTPTYEECLAVFRMTPEERCGHPDDGNPNS